MTEVKNLLYRYGFGYVWLSQCVGNTKLFILEFTVITRVKDEKRQEWRSDLCTNEKTNYYRNFKTEVTLELYTSCSNLFKYRRALARFRCGNHPLEIETGRLRGIYKDFRICQLCRKEIEDEYHFLLICTSWDHLRYKYLPRNCYRSPSLHTTTLMETKDENQIKNLALFIYHAFKIKEKM